MPPQTLATSVESLERRVTNLETLPERMDRVESQIVQLRKEIRDEFSAMRDEVRAGDGETRRFMRVLHEEVISRIALVEEVRRPGAGEKRRRGR